MNAEKPPRSTRFIGPAILLLAALIASAPVWMHGPVGADDFEFHMVSWLDARHSWLHGIPYPHWASSPNYGAGEPRFVFYPPLIWMLGASLSLVLPWPLLPVAMTFLMLAATGFAVRKLAAEFLPDPPATLAGCFALFSGYALFTAYDRAAFAELAGGFWIPLLLLFTLRNRNPSAPGKSQQLLHRALDGSTLPLALVVAGAWLSDAPVGVMASYLLACVSIVAALTQRAWFPILRASVAVILGVALTGIWLIPAAWEQKWVDITQATGVNGDPGLRIENNWLFPRHSDPALHARDLALHAISWINISMIALALFAAVIVFRKGKRTEDRAVVGRQFPRRYWIALAALPLLVLFFQLPVSLPVWNLLPKLRFLQFPWRWLLVVEAPMAIFLAAAIWPKSVARRPRAAIATLGAAACLAFTLFAATHFFRDPKEDHDLATIVANYRSGKGFAGTDEYAPPGAENTLVAIELPDACLTDDFDDEQGVQPNPDDNPIWRPDQHSCMSTFTAASLRPEHPRYRINAIRAGFLVLRLRSYPAWRVTVNGQPITNLQLRQDGLIAVPVPQGPSTITVDWTTTPDVFAGRSLSLLALLGLTALGLAERRLQQTNQSGQS